MTTAKLTWSKLGGDTNQGGKFPVEVSCREGSSAVLLMKQDAFHRWDSMTIIITGGIQDESKCALWLLTYPKKSKSANKVVKGH